MAQPLLNCEQVVIRSESPDQPRVRAPLEALDAYLGGLYAPQHNPIPGVGEPLSNLHGCCGYVRRASYGDCRDIGLSLFNGKRLDA
jgi:hypothetical protein